MNKILKINLLIFLLVSIFLGCEQKEKMIEEKEIIKSVFVIKPEEKDSTDNRVFSSLASSNNQIKLSFKVQGNIQYLEVQIGDEVKKGQVIAKLDSKPYTLKVAQIKYALSEANASLQNSKSVYERTKKLYINQNASVSDMDNARASYTAKKSKVENISKELEYALLQLSYTKLYAPISGIVAQKFISKDENINVGTPIVLLSDKVVDEVKIEIPESFINKIKINSEVKVVFNSIASKSFKAKISEISKFISQNEKTYKVVAKLTNSSNFIKSGMSADVYFDIKSNGLITKYLLPQSSILNDKNGYFVYIVSKKDDKYFIKRKNIKVENLIKEGFEVIEGLSKNDLVLKAGMSEVFENMEVTIGNKEELVD